MRVDFVCVRVHMYRVGWGGEGTRETEREKCID